MDERKPLLNGALLNMAGGSVTIAAGCLVGRCRLTSR